MTRCAACLFAFLSLAAMSGCLVNSSTRTEYSGRYISPKTIEQIEAGKTKEEFVMAILGGPTSKTPLSDGAEVWKWEYQKKSSSNGHVFLLVSANDHSEKQGATYIVMRCGMVEKVWQD